MIENDVEKYLKNQCKKENIICFKFTAPSFAGVPDRIIIVDGITAFIELKRPKAETRPLQNSVIQNMRNHKAIVLRCDMKEKVAFILDNLKKKNLPTYLRYHKVISSKSESVLNYFLKDIDSINCKIYFNDLVLYHQRTTKKLDTKYGLKYEKENPFNVFEWYEKGDVIIKAKENKDKENLINILNKSPKIKIKHIYGDCLIVAKKE